MTTLIYLSMLRRGPGSAELLRGTVEVVELHGIDFVDRSINVPVPIGRRFQYLIVTRVLRQPLRLRERSETARFIPYFNNDAHNSMVPRCSRRTFDPSSLALKASGFQNFGGG